MYCAKLFSVLQESVKTSFVSIFGVRCHVTPDRCQVTSRVGWWADVTPGGTQGLFDVTNWRF